MVVVVVVVLLCFTVQWPRGDSRVSNGGSGRRLAEERECERISSNDQSLIGRRRVAAGRRATLNSKLDVALSRKRAGLMTSSATTAPPPHPPHPARLRTQWPWHLAGSR